MSICTISTTEDFHRKLTREKIPQSPVSFSNPCMTDSIQMINRFIKNYDFDVHLKSIGKNLQRGYCWTEAQKQAFILSLLQGKGVTPLHINHNCDEDTYEIIDGKQRLSTLLDFYNNKFPIVIDDCEYFYKHLSRNLSYRISLFSFNAHYHRERKLNPKSILSDEDKIKWFLYVNNTGTPQQDEWINDLKKEINSTP